MTSARLNPQTNCVTERWLSTCPIDLTLCGSRGLDMTTRGARGAAWTSTKPRAFKNRDDATITGTSATDVISIGEQFQFPRPGNG